MTVIGSTERIAYRYVLVVMDMQPAFLSSLERQNWLVKNVCQQIRFAQMWRNDIIVVSSRDHGAIDPRIAAEFGSYPIYHVEKTAGDASDLVASVCLNNGIATGRFRLCGTGSDTGMCQTGVGLRNMFPDSELEIVVDCCNPSRNNWAGYGIGSATRTKFTTVLGTQAQMLPRLIDGRTLVLVDLQDSFVSAVLGRDNIIAAARREILLAKAAGDAIVRVNYGNCGITNEHVDELLQGYHRLAEIEKTREDGSAEVSDACVRRGFGTSVMRACGVYAVACLYGTVAGLGAYYPGGRIQVVRQGCDFSPDAAKKFRDAAPSNLDVVNVGSDQVVPAA